MRPPPASLLDIILEVCRAFPAYTIDSVLEMPMQRFWLVVDNLRRHRREQAELARRNPLAALALDHAR